MGKPKREDLRQGIITLPVIKLLKDEKYGDWLRNIIVKKDLSNEALGWVDQALSETGILLECYNTAELHLDKANQYLRKLPISEFSLKMYKITEMFHAYTGKIRAYLQV
jgi:heptaprenyl diphosphate synthase